MMRILTYIALSGLSIFLWYIILCIIEYIVTIIPPKYLEFFHNIF